MREPYKVGWHHAIKLLFEEYKRLKATEPKSDELKEKVRSLREGIIYLCEPYRLSQTEFKPSPTADPEVSPHKEPWDASPEFQQEYSERLQMGAQIHVKNKLIALDTLYAIEHE